MINGLNINAFYMNDLRDYWPTFGIPVYLIKLLSCNYEQVNEIDKSLLRSCDVCRL